MRSLFYFLLSWPLRLLVRCKIVPDNAENPQDLSDCNSTFYILRHRSASDLIALQMACKKQGLPDPLENVDVGGKSFRRCLCLEQPSSIFP